MQTPRRYDRCRIQAAALHVAKLLGRKRIGVESAGGRQHVWVQAVHIGKVERELKNTNVSLDSLRISSQACDKPGQIDQKSQNAVK
eukprot:350915-Chlamydomonas_euryale.AAC.3